MTIVVFLILFVVAVIVFYKKIKQIRKAIFLGHKHQKTDNHRQRWLNTLRIAIGQSKMTVRPIAGFFHILIYVGFIISSIELIEIITDGFTGKHRIFSHLPFYNFIISTCEFFAVLVIIACVVFLLRRNVLRIDRFHSNEMKKWPTLDANLILIFEIVLMVSFLFMNATDLKLQELGHLGYAKTSNFLISSPFKGMLSAFSAPSLVFIERVCWWFHVIGIFLFLNYVPYSKHFHIFLAFPNVFYASLNPLGKLNNMESVKKEVELMMNPDADPFAVNPESEAQENVASFGVKDVTDLSWQQILSSFTCTECGRCTSSCPANITGKVLSPRKIMIDVKNRAKEYAAGKAKENTLLHNFISKEELRACNTCNACTEACPVNIDPLTIILEMRRFLVMEESDAPSEWTSMFSNIENNGAPWQFSQTDRVKWRDEYSQN